MIQNVAIKANYKLEKKESFDSPDGKFRIVINDTFNLESVSFIRIGYETLVISSKKIFSHLRNNKNEFTVTLKKKEVNLSQVEITAKLPFYQNENATLLDYEITHEGNLILVMEKLIFLISPKDSIIKSIKNTQGISKIIKACSGRIFFLNSNLIFPTFISTKDLLISKDPLEIEYPLDQINELVACDSIIKIKESIGPHNQALIYRIQLASEPESEITFYIAKNKDLMKLARVEKKEIDREKVPDRMKAYLTGDELQKIRNHDKKVWKYEFFTSKLLYSPIFIKNDSILIFDYGTKKIMGFSYLKEGSQLKLKTIISDTLKNVKKDSLSRLIVQDSHTRELFSVLREGSVTLTHVVFGNSKTHPSIELPIEHKFVSNIKMYNHVVYYLWRDPNSQIGTKTLHKAFVIKNN